MTLTLEDHDFGAAALTFDGIETLDVVSNINATGVAADDGKNVFGGAVTMTDTAATERINVSGDEDPTRVLITSAPYFDIDKVSSYVSGDPNVLLAGETLGDVEL